MEILASILLPSRIEKRFLVNPFIVSNMHNLKNLRLLLSTTVKNKHFYFFCYEPPASILKISISVPGKCDLLQFLPARKLYCMLSHQKKFLFFKEEIQADSMALRFPIYRKIVKMFLVNRKSKRKSSQAVLMRQLVFKIRGAF